MSAQKVKQHDSVSYSVKTKGSLRAVTGIVQDVTTDGQVFVSRNGREQNLDILRPEDVAVMPQQRRQRPVHHEE